MPPAATTASTAGPTAPRAATTLAASARRADGSRAARRLRRSGLVPGVVYGGGEPPAAVAFAARELRHALAAAGAVIELRIDGAAATPVVLKELARHPVSGETVHVDLLRVRMDRAIQATVIVELTGAEDAPGVREGGVLEHITRELTIEALPGDIPDTIVHDVSTMAVGDTLTLAQLDAPAGVQILADPETVIATLTPPRLQAESEPELEAETEIVGQAGAGEATQAGSADAGDNSGE